MGCLFVSLGGGQVVRMVSVDTHLGYLGAFGVRLNRG